MAKQEGHAYHKPKPRVAIYGGAAVGVARLGTDAGGNVADIVVATNKRDAMKSVASGIVASPGEAAIKAGVPAAAGVLVSVAADKLGVNKALAKARAPFRV